MENLAAVSREVERFGDYALSVPGYHAALDVAYSLADCDLVMKASRACDEAVRRFAGQLVPEAIDILRRTF